MLNWFLKRDNDNCFRMITEGRCGTIVFDDKEKRCEIYYEMSGVTQYDILISFNSLKYWVRPKDTLISDHEKEKLRSLLIEWLKKEGLKAEL